MKKILIATVLVFSVFSAQATELEKGQTVEVAVTEKGFEPSSINVKPGSLVTLNITRKTDATCATQVVVPSKKIKKDLPLNKMVAINLGKLPKGEIGFGCGMNMMVSARIIAN